MKRHTCDKCKHYSLDDPLEYPLDGACALMGDSNEGGRVPDRAYGWDCEGYAAGVYVGPKFGCIHWEKKVFTGSPGEPVAHDTDDLTKE